MRRVLITGAAGLVGGELARQLEQKGGVEVVCVVRGAEAQARLRQRVPGARCEWVDLEDFGQVRELIRKVDPDVVFHTAAKVSVGDSAAEASGRRMIAGNQDMTHFVCEALLERKTAHLVHVSSIAALGTGAELIDETTPFTDMERASAYSRSKFLCHQEAVRAAKMGLRVSIVCPSVVVGVGSGLGQMDVLFRWIRRGLPVATRGEMGYVDVQDVAAAMILLAEQGVEDTVVLNGANLSFADFVEVFGKPFGRPRPRMVLGRGVLRAAGVVCRAWAAVGGGKPLVTRAVADYLCDRARYDGSKITKLGFSYTPIEETARTVAERLEKR